MTKMFCFCSNVLAGVAVAKDYVLLRNAAQPNQRMPWIGLGTGSYNNAYTSYGHYPKCFQDVYGTHSEQ